MRTRALAVFPLRKQLTGNKANIERMELLTLPQAFRFPPVYKSSRRVDASSCEYVDQRVPLPYKLILANGHGELSLISCWQKSARCRNGFLAAGNWRARARKSLKRRDLRTQVPHPIKSPRAGLYRLINARRKKGRPRPCSGRPITGRTGLFRKGIPGDTRPLVQRELGRSAFHAQALIIRVKRDADFQAMVR